MKNFILVILLAFIFVSCKESTNPLNNNPESNNKPVFPMPGYNARNTSNPYCINTYMNPVQGGVEDWTFTFQGNSFSDGSEFCVDSKNNIYYVCQASNIGGLYKFSQNGDVIWKKDSLTQDNFCGISLSADESKIYVSAHKIGTSDNLYCIDSTGKDVWSIPSSTYSKPLIGKEGTLYTFNNGGLAAITKYGALNWVNNSIQGYAGKYEMAIDGEDNVYAASNTSAVFKIDKTGNQLWRYNTGFQVYGIVIDGYSNIYFNGSNDSLYCLKPNGLVKWTKSGTNQYSSLAITSDNKIFVSSGINIIAYDTGGVQLWKTQAFTSAAPENIMIDDENNVYYLGDNSPNIIVGSISSSGIKRWDYTSSLSSTLPAPSLIPSGKLIFAQKRAWKIQVLK